MKDWLWDLSKVANFVVAVGDCATWGGIPAMSPNPSQSTGLQFLKREEGGFLGKDFRAKSGLPVINIPGCPSHPDWINQILVAIATGRIGDIALDELHRPQTFFKTFTQTGCTRNIHFAYKASTGDFGQRKGCLFYDLGCRGPMTHSSCNRILWNRVSSKTRAGMPCIGCTEPEFPFYDLKPGTVFKTHVLCTVWYSRWIANIIDFCRLPNFCPLAHLLTVIENIVKSRRVLSIAPRNLPYDYRAPKLARTRKPH